MEIGANIQVFLMLYKGKKHRATIPKAFATISQTGKHRQKYSPLICKPSDLKESTFAEDKTTFFES
jgi:hypothetical protein